MKRSWNVKQTDDPHSLIDSNQSPTRTDVCEIKKKQSSLYVYFMISQRSRSESINLFYHGRKPKETRVSTKMNWREEVLM